MPHKDQPGGGASVHLLKVVLDPVILFRPTVEIVLCAHHHKVDLAIVKAEPRFVVTIARHGEPSIVRHSTLATRV